MEPENLSEEELFLSNDNEESVEEQVEANETAELAKPVKEEQVETVAEVAATEEEVKPEEVASTEAVKETQKEDEAVVPSWRLREVNEKAAQAQQQVQQERERTLRLEAEVNALRQQTQQQTQQQAPDVYEDPNGFAEYQNQQVQVAFKQLQLQNARVEAMARYGYEKVEEAYKAAVEAEYQNPGLGQRIATSENPWLEAVNWHQEVQTQQVIGEGGIDGFRQREREALMQDPDFRKEVFEKMRAESGVVSQKQVETIPSLNSATTTTVETTADGERVPSEDELFLAS